MESLSISSSISDDQSSVVSWGGTRRPMADVIDKLSAKIKLFLDTLTYYKDLFSFLNDETRGHIHPWFEVPEGRLSWAHYTTRVFLLYNDWPSSDKFICAYPDAIVRYLENNDIDLPTFADLRAEHPGLLDTTLDPAEDALQLLNTIRDEILDLGTFLETAPWRATKPTPAQFRTPAGWRVMQNSDAAILCHQPGNKRPNVALKVMHKAFEEFSKTVHFSDVKLQPFRIAAQELAECIVKAMHEEAPSAKAILAVLKTIFEENDEFRWILEKKGLTYLIYQKIDTQETHSPINVMIFGIREAGKTGDTYMQLCRYFDDVVHSNSRFREIGIPTFLVAMSGPDIQFCGGWADATNQTSIDVFETMFMWLPTDCDYERRDDLAHRLCKLDDAIKFLPLFSVPLKPKAKAAAGVPSVFEDYELYEEPGSRYSLKLMCRLPADRRHTVFFAYAEYIPLELPRLVFIQGLDEANCVAKLVYGERYGVEVHQALEPNFSPKLFGSSVSEAGAFVLVMEYLFPPTDRRSGWIPLSELDTLAVKIEASQSEAVSDALDALLDALSKKGFVHGDLQPTNVMIAMKDRSHIKMPVEIKALDFEWAGPVGEAHYPYGRSSGSSYPGNAGDPIGVEDDRAMVYKLKTLVASCLSDPEGL